VTAWCQWLASACLSSMRWGLTCLCALLLPQLPPATPMLLTWHPLPATAAVGAAGGLRAGRGARGGEWSCAVLNMELEAAANPSSCQDQLSAGVWHISCYAVCVWAGSLWLDHSPCLWVQRGAASQQQHQSHRPLCPLHHRASHARGLVRFPEPAGEHSDTVTLRFLLPLSGPGTFTAQPQHGRERSHQQVVCCGQPCQACTNHNVVLPLTRWAAAMLNCQGALSASRPCCCCCSCCCKYAR
jgi:hypothetical protein